MAAVIEKDDDADLHPTKEALAVTADHGTNLGLIGDVVPGALWCQSGASAAAHLT